MKKEHLYLLGALIGFFIIGIFIGKTICVNNITNNNYLIPKNVGTMINMEENKAFIILDLNNKAEDYLMYNINAFCKSYNLPSCQTFGF